MKTTIAIDRRLRDDIKSFGLKGETYEDIIRRLYESAKERQLQDLLLSSKDAVPIRTALERAKKRWSK